MIVQNFTSHDIDICGFGQCFTVPMAREANDEEGNLAVVPGEVDVSSDFLEKLKGNLVVKGNFESGNLKVKAIAKPKPSDK
jgi:hypothetical protein